MRLLSYVWCFSVWLVSVWQMPQHTGVQLMQLLVWCGPRRISEAPAKCMFENTYCCGRAGSIKCKLNLVSTAILVHWLEGMVQVVSAYQACRVSAGLPYGVICQCGGCS
jgi:hypothetical protein